VGWRAAALARRDFAQARALLKVTLGDKPGHDCGPNWLPTYAMKSWQREAEALFQAKGIPRPSRPRSESGSTRRMIFE
jgi:hypothetical protein